MAYAHSGCCSAAPGAGQGGQAGLAHHHRWTRGHRYCDIADMHLAVHPYGTDVRCSTGNLHILMWEGWLDGAL